MTGRERSRHLLRIVASIVIVMLYAPIVTYAAIEFVGGAALQQLFDWITGRCGQCSAQRQIVVLLLVGILALTALALMFGLYIWVRRASRSDRQAVEAEHYFQTTPERVPPASVDVDPVEPRFYRDRRGRLRPLKHFDEEPR